MCVFVSLILCWCVSDVYMLVCLSVCAVLATQKNSWEMANFNPDYSQRRSTLGSTISELYSLFYMCTLVWGNFGEQEMLSPLPLLLLYISFDGNTTDPVICSLRDPSKTQYLFRNIYVYLEI